MNCYSILFVLILLISTVCAVDEIFFLNIQSDKQRIGDAIVIHSGNEYAMIDVGYGKTTGDKAVSFNNLSKFLNKNKITNIEWILLTHNHPDHVGGIEDLLNLKVKNNKGKLVNLKVGTVFTKDYSKLDSDCGGENSDYSSPKEYRKKREDKWNTRKRNIKEKTNLYIITKKKIPDLKLGNYVFKLYNTDQVFEKYGTVCENLCTKCNCNTIEGCNENTNSIIAVARNGKVHYFFSGDIENYPNKKEFNSDKIRTIQYWVDLAKKDFGIDHFDVFKASHHGFKRNNPVEVYQSAKPDKCIVSSKNVINEVVNNIKNGNKNVKIYYTGDGTVKITQEKNKIKRNYSD